MDEMIEKINSILRFQMNFNWQQKSPYLGDNNIYYKNSFIAHVHKHPIRERYKYKYGERWNVIIDYSDYKKILDSYYKVSNYLSKKFSLVSTSEYDIQYIKNQESVNIVDMNNGLVVCLKFDEMNNYFYIATCFFPSKLNKLLSIKHEIFSEKISIEKKNANNMLHFIPFKDIDIHNEINLGVFKEAMEDFFGSNSLEYQILFKNKIYNADGIISNIIREVTEYLSFMKNIITNESDKKYYFVFNDGIEYIAKWSLLYKIKDKNHERLYQDFLNIDVNNVYKDALDLCKKYIDESERLYGRNN